MVSSNPPGLTFFFRANREQNTFSMIHKKERKALDIEVQKAGSKINLRKTKKSRVLTCTNETLQLNSEVTKRLDRLTYPGSILDSEGSPMQTLEPGSKKREQPSFLLQDLELWDLPF